MNIAVKWDRRLVFDKKAGGLVEIDSNDTTSEYYYQVCCAKCNTQVAALSPSDEVYHFYGCLASA